MILVKHRLLSVTISSGFPANLLSGVPGPHGHLPLPSHHAPQFSPSTPRLSVPGTSLHNPPQGIFTCYFFCLERSSRVSQGPRQPSLASVQSVCHLCSEPPASGLSLPNTHHHVTNALFSHMYLIYRLSSSSQGRNFCLFHVMASAS